MRKHFLFSALLLMLLCNSSCVKSVGNDGLVRGGCKGPHNAAPVELRGGWGNNFGSYTQILNVFNGVLTDYNWEKGMYFSFTSDGTGAEFYAMFQDQFAQHATKAIGSVEFDEGSTAQSGSFTFYACRARVRSWGNLKVDRNATDEEVQQLTCKYYYIMQGEWLRIEPNTEPNSATRSFRKID